jgi:hypothetical protein
MTLFLRARPAGGRPAKTAPSRWIPLPFVDDSPDVHRMRADGSVRPFRDVQSSGSKGSFAPRPQTFDGGTSTLGRLRPFVGSLMNDRVGWIPDLHQWRSSAGSGSQQCGLYQLNQRRGGSVPNDDCLISVGVAA